MPKNAPGPVQTAHAAPAADGRQALQALLPAFYAAAGDFEDLNAAPGLGPEEIAGLEKKLEFTFSKELRELIGHCAALSMAGLSVKAAEFGPIVMPGSEALVIGEFYLYSPGDRLLMLAGDPAVYYLEQHNGAITKMADGIIDFFEKTLVKYLQS
ncbi:SMI1/KNR4 family protein [Desulfovibrio sp. ZJ200]|uniref:SMI1/KNR4 family protein n=1 Tax=Desulfovibrio sp. ZJ200 TaxID=2709792 RepID=UPI0013E9F230|nr:SMI1/KNR4 family protein [Desulfovibrio sp. ZJ200]